MANVLYNLAKQKFLAPGTLGTTSGTAIDMLDDDLKVVLVDADYTFSAAHEFLDSIVVGDRVATSANLAGKTVSTAGVFDADDITFTAVSGSQVTQVVIYKDTGTEGTSSLIVYYDTMTGLPVTPNGGDITIAWNAGGIFNL